jgi:hypothetical protein
VAGTLLTKVIVFTICQGHAVCDTSLLRQYILRLLLASLNLHRVGRDVSQSRCRSFSYKSLRLLRNLDSVGASDTLLRHPRIILRDTAPRSLLLGQASRIAGVSGLCPHFASVRPLWRSQDRLLIRCLFAQGSFRLLGTSFTLDAATVAIVRIGPKEVANRPRKNESR